MTSFQEQVQLLILPKFFNCEKFAFKSDYNIRIQFIYESESGRKMWACPFVVKSPEMFTSSRKQKKQPKMIVQNKRGFYQTEQFHIQYEDDSYTFREMCIFKLQLNGKKQNKGKTYLQVSLLSHRNTLMQSKKNLTVEKTCRQIQKKRLYVNRKRQELGQFYRLSFTDNDYFGNFVFFVGSVHLGWKVRKNKITLCEFISLKTEQRKKIISQEQNEKISAPRKYGKLIKNTIKFFCDSLQHYFDITLMKAILQNIRLVQMFEKMKEKLDYQEEPHFKKIQSNYQTYLSLTGEFSGLAQHYDTDDINQLYHAIFYEAELICTFNHWIWQIFYTMMIRANPKNMKRIVNQQVQMRQERFFSLVSEEGIVDDDLDSRSTRVHSYKLSRRNYLRHVTLYEEEDLKHPFVMFQTQNSSLIRKSTFQSLVIMIHGYQGNSRDLQKASNYIHRYNKNCDVMHIHNLQTQPQIRIKHAAEICANQIKYYLQKTQFSYKFVSIIGYSLGGIIARAVLEYLPELKDKFKLLITFSSPHLGLASSENSLVRMGIWFMVKFQKAAMIGDMNGSEQGSCCKSYMKILSECRNLSWFQKIVLVGSREDQFIPHCSSSVRSSPIDSQTSHLVSNIQENAKKMERVQIWFDIDDEAGRLDKMTGRKAHIEFLDNDKFLNTFFQIYAHQL